MLEAAFIRDNAQAVRTNCVNRNVHSAEVDRVLSLDDQRKSLISKTQQIQQRQNEISKLIPQEKDKAKKDALIVEGKSLRTQAGELEAELKRTEIDLHAVLLAFAV